jgi:hypothetical protein
MIIAVITVRMVQMAGDEAVDVVAVWDCFVAATGSMHMSSIMSGAAMVGRATIRVLVTHSNPMLVHMIRMRMVKMAVVEIVHVVAVPDGNVAAAGSMRVVVVGMVRKIASGHFEVLSLKSVVFAGVRDGVLDQLEHMGIGDRVDRVLALAPALDETGLQQNLQARRNRAHPFVFGLNEFADIPFPGSQGDERPEPCGIGQSLEHGCCLLNVRPVNRFDHLLHHSIDCWNIALTFALSRAKMARHRRLIKSPIMSAAISPQSRAEARFGATETIPKSRGFSPDRLPI